MDENTLLSLIMLNHLISSDKIVDNLTPSVMFLLWIRLLELVSPLLDLQFNLDKLRCAGRKSLSAHLNLIRLKHIKNNEKKGTK